MLAAARAGNSPLAATWSTVGTQATPEYFASTADSMRMIGGNARNVGSDLLNAYNTGNAQLKWATEMGTFAKRLMGMEFPRNRSKELMTPTALSLR